ncbi:MAG: hypothetical protein LBF78_10615 [Treponema sp.]|jgi:hypothetical protein|nr:hypothetical protein [Treponema sp.]
MKKKFWLAAAIPLACRMFFFNLTAVFPQDTGGFDLKLPTLNLDMDSYIQEETSTWLSLINKHGDTGRKFDIYSSTFADIAFQKDEEGKIDWNDSVMNFNFYFPVKIRINDSFSVPVYASYFGTDLGSNKYQDDDPEETNPNGMLWGMGSGLVYTGEFGTFAGLAGFKMRMANTYASNDDSNFSPALYLVPIINTSGYPLFGAVFKTVGGYLGLNEGKVSNYSVSLVSQAVEVGFIRIDSIDVYLNSQKYKFEAEAKNYGARLNIMFPIPIGFGIDAGYRVFPNAANNADAYRDGWFAKLKYITAGGGIMRSILYVSFDTMYYPLPKFGLEGFFNLYGLQEAVFMELGFPEDRFEFTLGGRVYFDLGVISP